MLLKIRILSIIVIFGIQLCFSAILSAQNALEEELYSVGWARTLGGEFWDEATEIIQTADKGFTICGFTLQEQRGVNELQLNGYTSMANDKYVWIVKIDAWGRRVWGHTYGDSTYLCEAQGIVENEDGSYVVVGASYPRAKYRYDSDLWLMKIDAYGDVIWVKNYGDGNNQGGTGIVKASDGGYTVCGFTESNEELTADFWIVHIDAEGNLMWEETFGGSESEFAFDITNTSDDCVAVAGYNESRGQANRVMWVVKLDANGWWTWDEIYNVSDWDEASCIAEASDGGFLVGGITRGEGLNNFDARIIKVDKDGLFLWGQTYGGSEWEEITSVVETYDNGIAVAAFTKSHGEFDDFWIIKMNPAGVKVWDKTFGGSNFDYTTEIIETEDLGLVVAGSTFTSQTVGWDFAILKLNRAGFKADDFPQINMRSPTQTNLSVDSSVYHIDMCINSKHPIERIKIMINDTIFADSVAVLFDSLNNECDYRLITDLPLSVGSNRVSIEIQNIAGSTVQDFHFFYLMLFRIRW